MPCFFNTYRLKNIQVTWFLEDETQSHKTGNWVLTNWETRSNLKYCQIGVALDLQWMSFRFIQLEHLALQWNVRLEIKENHTGMWDVLVQLHFQTFLIFSNYKKFHCLQALEQYYPNRRSDHWLICLYYNQTILVINL